MSFQRISIVSTVAAKTRKPSSSKSVATFSNQEQFLPSKCSFILFYLLRDFKNLSLIFEKSSLPISSIVFQQISRTFVLLYFYTTVFCELCTKGSPLALQFFIPKHVVHSFRKATFMESVLKLLFHRF